MEDVLLEEDFGVAEPEHVEMMMDALADTMEQQVAGNESYSLTSAQQYALSVLQSSGAVSRIAQVTGNEGFFSSIGDGVKKLWEYIQKIFKGIYDWFFGKKEKGPSLLEETEAQIEACNNSLKAWAANDAKLKMSIAPQMINTIEELDKFMLGDDHSVKGEAKALKEEIQAAKSLPEDQQVAVTKKVMEKMVKLNRRTQRAIREVCEEALEKYKRYYTIAEEDHSAQFADTVFKDTYTQYLAWVKEGKQKPLDAYIMIPTSLDGFSHAMRAQESLLKAIKSLEEEKTLISRNFKSDVVSRMKKTEEMLTSKTLNDDGRKQLNKTLSACKLFMSLTTQAIKQIEETCRTIQRINKMIMRLFGLPVPRGKSK